MSELATVLRVVVSLAVVFGVIWYLSRRFHRRAGGGARTAPAVRVLGKAGVAAKASVVVVEAEGRRLVLGVTEHGVSVLHDAEAVVPAPEPTFEQVLAAAPQPDPVLAAATAVADPAPSRGAAAAAPVSRGSSATAGGVSRPAPAKPATLAKPARAVSLAAGLAPRWNPAPRNGFRAALLDEVKALISK